MFKKLSVAMLMLLGVWVQETVWAQSGTKGGQDDKELSGLVYELPDGNLANLLIRDRFFTLTFHDKDKKLIKPLYDKAILHYESVAKKENEGTMTLLPSGDGLVASKVVLPPNDFFVRLILKDDTDDSRKRIFQRQRLKM